MGITLFERIHDSIRDKRENLATWVDTASAEEKSVHLGPAGAEPLQAHLQVMDTTLAKTQDQTLGLCIICHEPVDTPLLEMDYTSCVCLDHFTEPEKRQLESELEFSQEIQRALLPQEAPDISGVELAGFSQPAQILGGDIFDFPRYRDGMYGLAIADAMGHGVSASLLMTSLLTSLRTLVPENLSPVDVLEKINRLFLHNIHFTTFATVFLGWFDPQQRRLTYCNAGHNPPALYIARKKEVQWLMPTGASIGLVENFQIEPVSLTLEEGDVLLLYTDGVVEAHNGQPGQFGYDRLSSLAQRNANLKPNELVQTLRRELAEFTDGHPLEDDVTIVAFKIVPR